jgi:hypothetical protein
MPKLSLETSLMIIGGCLEAFVPQTVKMEKKKKVGLPKMPLIEIPTSSTSTILFGYRKHMMNSTFVKLYPHHKQCIR